jgi:hypothetical protein
MTRSRLISSFEITATDKVLYVSYNGGADTAVTLTEGTYYWNCDGAADDFAAMLKARLEATFGGTTWTVQITGVNHVDATVCSGRVVISEAAQNFELVMTHASWTVDPRILGWIGTADEASAGKELTSDWVHRYGWYPQTQPVEDVIKTVSANVVDFSTTRYRSGVTWGRHESASIAFDVIPSALVRIEAAADATRTAEVLVTTGDLNCPFERFVLDLAGDHTRRWRLYLVETAMMLVTDYYGPYVFAPDSPLWQDPLAQSLIQDKAGELWTCIIGGEGMPNWR